MNDHDESFHIPLFQDADKKVVFMNIKELGESHAAFYQEQCWANFHFNSHSIVAFL